MIFQLNNVIGNDTTKYMIFHLNKARIIESDI